MAGKKWVYLFHEIEEAEKYVGGDWDDVRGLLGGKGANLAEMARIGLPVPPGFIVTTEACNAYQVEQKFPDGLWDEMLEDLAVVEKEAGKKFGSNTNPLLVSCRSGAKYSMPGMMDTVLNIGLNDESAKGMVALTNNERFVFDSYRRLIQMFGSVVLGIPDEAFEQVLDGLKHSKGYKADTEMTAGDLKSLVEQFKVVVRNEKGFDFPQDPLEQLRLATEAVFKSWNGKRAVDYRRATHISDSLGTAVSIVTMVFGNMGETSGTGVGFTRNAADGTKEYYGDFLTNAQGEDVVAGIRKTRPISELPEVLPEAGKELYRVFEVLEQAYRDMCDIEFTIQEGKLWMLQTRVGKRTARAALKIAVDMVDEGLITREEAVMRINPAQLDQLMHPQFDTTATYDVLAKGLNASPGAAVGEVVFTADDAEAAAAEGRKVILLRWETNPDDLHGMVAAQGILTSHGGKTSHAAVIARGMGKPAVCGAEALKIDMKAKQATVSGKDVVLKEGDVISIDGTTGIVVLGEVALVQPDVSGDMDTILGWADEFRTMGVRANADTPEDAALGRRFGAEGIGLARTEHMFLGERKDIIQDFILSESAGVRQQALDELLEVQTGDFLGIFSEMDALPVTVRLLDPPLHEFLDSPRELEVEIVRAEAAGASAEELAPKRTLLARIDAMSEANPMLGLRGCRLGIVHPELYALQVEAITRAACELKKKGLNPIPEVMIPLTGHVNELKRVQPELESIAKKVMEESELLYPAKRRNVQRQGEGEGRRE